MIRPYSVTTDCLSGPATDEGGRRISSIPLLRLTAWRELSRYVLPPCVVSGVSTRSPLKEVYRLERLLAIETADLETTESRGVLHGEYCDDSTVASTVAISQLGVHSGHC